MVTTPTSPELTKKSVELARRYLESGGKNSTFEIVEHVYPNGKKDYKKYEVKRELMEKEIGGPGRVGVIVSECSRRGYETIKKKKIIVFASELFKKL